MKTFIIALLVLVVLISGILTYCSYLKTTENDLRASINKIVEAINKNDWKKSYESYISLEKLWDENEGVLAMFNDHEELDEIELALGDLKESIFYEDSEHAQKAITEMKILLERLIKNESLSLGNILKVSHNGLFCHNML